MFDAIDADRDRVLDGLRAMGVRRNSQTTSMRLVDDRG
jgi:hypothetical protein